MATNRTVLEFVQDILSYMEGDFVNDIGETEESEMILQVLEGTFYDVVDEFELPYKYGNSQLTASGTTSQPTHMTLPGEVSRVEEILYDTLDNATDPTNYSHVTYKTPKEFMQLINARNSNESNVDKITDDTGITFLIVNDANPRYWTSFDDKTIVFDSYDSNLDSWLQNSKTWVTGYSRPEWVNNNTHKPDLPEHLEQYFFNEACSLAYINHKQVANAKVEQRASRQRISVLNNYRRAGTKITRPHYGRK